MPDTVRAARAEDAADIARIYNQGIADGIATFETEPRTPERMARTIAERADRYPSVVVERDGRVVAWASASEYRPRECYAGIAEFSVYVDRAARGTGAGTAAMRGLIDACAARGFWKLVSRVFPENAASRGLLRSLGFREVGVYERHAKLDGEWKDVVIVEKHIGERGLMPQLSAREQARLLERLRKICLALPDTSEKLSHGEAAFFHKKRSFLNMDTYHHGEDRFAAWVAAPLGAQDTLVRSDPERFFVPPYVGYRGWVGVRLDRDPDWDEIARIVADAHALVET